MYTPIVTVSCRIMILSTLQRGHSLFFEENGVNWWRTPPESPDLNPIENFWHELKEFLRREIKPRTKEELVVGIRRFWDGVTAEKVHAVHSAHKASNFRVISENGRATGF